MQKIWLLTKPIPPAIEHLNGPWFISGMISKEGAIIVVVRVAAAWLSRVYAVGLNCLALLLLSIPTSRADDVVLNPGDVLTLQGDLVLSGSDNLIATQATIDGSASWSITSSPDWVGSVWVDGCLFLGLGSPSTASTPGKPALQLDCQGSGSIQISNSDFDGCNQTLINTWDNSTITLEGNTWKPNGTYYVSGVAFVSQAALVLGGDSPAAKWFDNNYVLRCWLEFQSDCWNIEANVVAGRRGGCSCFGTGNIAYGNYFHADLTITDDFPFWSQVENVKGSYDDFGYNIVDTADWPLRSVSGYFHDSLVLGVGGHDFVQSCQAEFYNCIFALNQRDGTYSMHGINMYEAGDWALIHHCVFDAGPSLGWQTMSEGVTIGAGTSGMVFDCAFVGFVSAACVDGGGDLIYADFNLFDGDPESVDNYDISVPGLRQRLDPGFGYYDVHAGSGIVNEKVPAQLQGPIPNTFPFSPDDLVSGTLAVEDVLAYFWSVYSPAPGSPLINAGSDGTNIGIR